MKNTKTKVASIVLILLLTVAMFLTFLAAVNAADVPTYAFLNISPNPVGVGQTTIVTFWIDKVPPTAGIADWGDRWQNYTITVTNPDGTSSTLGPFTSDPVGAGWTSFTPDQVGTYTFEFNFPGQRITGFTMVGPIDNYYQPSTSPQVMLTVQQEQIQPYPAAQIPTEYWERPINAQNREWSQISGDWLMTYYDSTGNKYNPYTTGPESPHILWRRPLAFGGLAGGSFGGEPYYTGLSYENKFLPPIILHGRLYYNNRMGSSAWKGFTCVDLRTGEEIWYQDTDVSPNVGFGGGTLTLGQVMKYETPNQYGVIPYLWYIGPTYKMYDAFTGEQILTIANVSVGGYSLFGPDVCTFGPSGEILIYILDGMNSWLALWNSTLAIPPPGTYGTDAWQWRPQAGATYDWKNGIQWNVTTPTFIGPGPQAIATNNAITPIVDYQSGIILAFTGSFLLGTATSWTEIGYDAITGEVVWTQNRTFPTQPTSWGIMGLIGEGVYCEFIPNTMQWYCYDITTGEELWGPTEPYTRAFGSYALAPSSIIAYGKLIGGNFDGMIHAYDLKTGEHLWDFDTPNMGLETVYGNTPIMSLSAADGKVYVSTGHTHLKPLYRGSNLHCLNATTGEEIWKISNFGLMTPVAIAEGYLVTPNAYDNSIYCIGKGPSKTTVTAAPKNSEWGDSVIIEGTVTDQSAGTEEELVKARFPNGLPAIADEYQEDWMEYVYMQLECPKEAQGVEVIISTLDPNGNTYELGRTTTDMSGTFGIEVEPPVPGLYKIIATFEGSDSYYSSYAETFISVKEAMSPGQQLEPEMIEATQATEAPYITTEVMIVIVIAIIAVLLLAGFYIFRKQE